MGGDIERAEDASISQGDSSKPREIQMLEQAKHIFQNVELSLGPRVALQIMMDGVNTFMRRTEVIKHLISSPDSRLADRIEKIIHEADPDASIKFQTFDQWAQEAPEEQKKAMGGMGPIGIWYRGNLPSDIEDRIHAEIRAALDSVLPGLSEKVPGFTLYLERLPEELEGPSGE